MRLNLPTDIALENLGPRGVTLEALQFLVWRDHPHSIPLRIGGFPIVDFCAHSHDIDVLVFRVTIPSSNIFANSGRPAEQQRFVLKEGETTGQQRRTEHAA